MPKYVRPNRPVERAAVNATTDFFERNHCIVQPVTGENDIGKDAYVDLTEGVRVTGIVIAVQIKGGAQVRRGTGYGVPFSADDAELFSDSTIPVIGIAFDEDSDSLWWVNLTDYCRERREAGNAGGGFASASGQLTAHSLPEFKEAMKAATAVDEHVSILDLVSDSSQQQASAVNDCLALGRRDPRAMLLLRRLFTTLHPDAILTGLGALAYLTPHPDIGWTSRNWISGPVKKRLRDELKWSPDELRLLLSVVDDDADMWGRGVAGENITMLLLQDPEIDDKLREMVRDPALDSHLRFRALVYLVYLTKNDDAARAVVREELNESPELTQDESVRQLTAEVRVNGWLDIF
jgi:hypothetical protein